jgi:hypothetical protein
MHDILAAEAAGAVTFEERSYFFAGGGDVLGFEKAVGVSGRVRAGEN